jgi:hypothetical protein
MNNLSKDILVGAFYIAGISSFISGLFVISAVLFATASMFTNIARIASSNS